VKSKIADVIVSVHVVSEM